jgi:hypothetical protein
MPTFTKFFADILSTIGICNSKSFEDAFIFHTLKGDVNYVD